jgi:signal transduction histidine kinase
VFYAVAIGGDRADRDVLLGRLVALESAIHRITDTGNASRDSVLWTRVRRASDAFIAEGREALRSRRPPSDEFFRRHQALLSAMADLANSSFTSSGAPNLETQRLSSRVRYSLVLLGIALIVAIVGALLTVYVVNRMFRQLRWQAAELAHLSSRTMRDQEETARRLSREMHDHFGQTLSAIEANLVSMQRARTFHQGRLEDCMGLVKDAVGNVREVSQLLRPTILDDFGLNASVRWLAEGFSERTGIPVRYTTSFSGRLDGERETQLFRIVQEALTNVARHSAASEVLVDLSADGQQLRLSISDNGKGIRAEDLTRGTGLVGMRARIRAAGGKVRMDSKPGEGVSITIELPLKRSLYESENSNSVSG